MIPEKLAGRIKELLRRKAKFRLELDSYDGRWQTWRIAETGKVSDGLDSSIEEDENEGTAVEN